MSVQSFPKAPVEVLLSQYAAVFQERFGEINTFTATLHLKEGTRSKFYKARPVPFALKEAIERDLDRLQKAGIVKKSHISRGQPQ